MKCTVILTTLSAFAAAQTVDDLPACSLDCLYTGMADSGCADTDTVCACSKADEINKDITPCLETNCAPDDDDDFRNIVTEICYNAGVPIKVECSGQMRNAQIGSSTNNYLFVHTY